MADNVFRDFLREQMFMDNNPQAKAEAEALLNFTNAYVEERKDKVLDSKAQTMVNIGRKMKLVDDEGLPPEVKDALLKLIKPE